MNKIFSATTVAFFALTLSSAQTTVFSSLLSPQPPNVPSQGYQCCATSELGDEITLAGTARVGNTVTVLMSSWAKHSDYPTLPAAGFMHPITLAIYDNALHARLHQPVFSITQNSLMLWRPEADPTCEDGGTAWRSPTDGKCYNGFAFTISFDLRHAGPGGIPVLLPGTFIYGIAYNTNSWGYNPLHLSGPYESLNVGLNDVAPPSVGTDVVPGTVFWNTSYGPFYTDLWAAGIGVFRPDTNWAPYIPAIQITAFGFATSFEACKNKGWQSVYRTNLTGFVNQGDCVSYVANGK